MRKKVNLGDSKFCQEVAQNREKAKKKGKLECKSGEIMRLICPSCYKPNVLNVQFCTGCAFELSEWDAQPISENPFLDLVKGKDTGTYVYFRNDQLLVADDMFGVSWTAHIQIIPLEFIEDIRFLTKEHIPLLNSLHEAGIEVLKIDNLSFPGRGVEEVVLAGFNFPVSIKQLHLHMILPPYKHNKIAEYPRWHSFEKVIKDLREFGKVITYDTNGNTSEGEKIHQLARKFHSIYEYMIIEKQYEEEWDKWFAANESTNLLWSYFDPDSAEICLLVGENELKLTYPDPKDPESVFFLSSVASISWLDYVQDWLSEKRSVSFTELLDKINAEMNPAKKRKPEELDDYDVDLDEEDYNLSFDPFSNMDWTEIEKKNYCQRLVYREVF